MAGRNRLTHHPDNFRSFYEDPRSAPLNRGPAPAPFRHAVALEDELDFQQREIQRLLAENRHVIDDNVVLERDLSAVKEEILRLNQVIAKGRADRDAHTRELMERAMKLEADLHSFDSLRADVKQLRAEMQNLGLQRQDLSSQIQSVNKDINRLKLDKKQVVILKADLDRMHKELTDARRTYEYEKKGNEELVEQNHAMENSLISMTRELDLLRSEVTTADGRPKGGIGGYGLVNGSTETGYTGQYRDIYGVGTWGSQSHDIQRGPTRR